MINKKLLFTYAGEMDFHALGLLTSHRLLNIFNNNTGTMWFDAGAIQAQCARYFGRDLFSPGSSFSFLMCGLAYYWEKADSLPGDNSPCGLFAPFARKNYYAEAVARLKKIASRIREITGLGKGEVRIFCNSGAPEKFLAWASGLGMYGKNSLIIHPSLGSSFIIAGLLVPFEVEGTGEREMPGLPGSGCGDCHACMTQCPVQAITSPGVIDHTRCIQALSTSLSIFPEYIKRAFQNRIYGCQVCQDVCPCNKDVSRETETNRGVLGPCIPLITLLQKAPGELKAYFRKTVPGSSWIDMRALQRNGLIAAGYYKDPSLVPFITPFLNSEHPALADAARWAMDALSYSPG